MAFKIRRGTNAERLTITPAEGELIYTTDTKKLYVGDGSTVGGTAVTDLSAYATTAYVDQAVSDIIDGAIPALDTLKELADALGSDPNFAGNLTTALANKVNSADLATVATSGDYDDLTNKPNIFSGNYDDLSNKPTIPSITGLASETYVNNKVSDLVNGATSTLDTLKELADALGNDQNFATTVTNSLANKANVVDLSAVATSGDYADLLNVPSTPDLLNVGSDILPSTDVTYDLGSPNKRFRDLYLSGSTIDLGGKTLSITGNTLSIGGNKFGESGNVVGVAITQLYNNTVYIRLDVGSAAETIANNIIAGDILKLDPDPAVGLITQLTVVSNDGGIVDTNNTAFKDYELTVAETGPSNAVNIFFDLVKPIATDVKQLKDSTGLLNRTSISSGPTAPGSAAVANANDVSINFSDAVGTKFKFNRDGKIDFPATQYGSSVSTMFAEYGFRFRPTWNGTGTGPELAISWNDGIELTPITNDHFTIGNKATPFFIQGTPTDQAGKLPGDVWVDGGFNGPANTKGIVNIGRGRTSAVNIGQSGTATTITFNDGSSITSANGLGGDILGDQNVDGGGGAVDVWSSPVNTAGMTAKVVVSGKDLATGETQSCEVLLAKKMGSQLVNVTVYAIVHTSASPLFTVSATVETDGQIRVNATVPGSIATVNVKSVGRVTVF
jgi:hypothetical protein